MSDLISQLLTGIAERDDDAAQKFLDDYFQRMVRLARWKLVIGDISKADFDEEDIAADTVSDFYEWVLERKFENVHDEVDLWRLLFRITVRKINDRRRYCFAKKRGSGQVWCLSDFESQSKGEEQNEPAEVLGKQQYQNHPQSSRHPLS
jgi:hypothetical protein